MAKKKNDENKELLDERGHKLLSPEGVDALVKDYLRLNKHAGARTFWNKEAKEVYWQTTMVILDYVNQGLSRKEIYQQICDRWDISEQTARNWYNRSIDWLHREHEDFENEVVDTLTSQFQGIVQDALEQSDRSNAIKALENIGKMYGVYRERKELEIKSDDPIVVKFGE